MKEPEEAKAWLKKIDALYDECDKEMTISLATASRDTFSVARETVEEGILMLETTISELEKEREALLRTLPRNIDFNRRFGIRGGNPSIIDNVLKDKRNWKKKSVAAGLGDEYLFLYSYTSDILHCYSYSIRTNAHVEEAEFWMFRTLSNKYFQKLIELLFRFCKVPSNLAIIDSEG